MIRGDWLNQGKEVRPGIPALFPPLPEGMPANRLALAKWLVDKRNPLTARVTVNRYWEQIFGVTLVQTPEDFGLRSTLPTHLELLDWLAVEFMAPSPRPSPPRGEGDVRSRPSASAGKGEARPWDVKKLLKLIVTSATYRQSSKVNPALAEPRSGQPPFCPWSAVPRFGRDDPRPGLIREWAAEPENVWAIGASAATQVRPYRRFWPRHRLDG